jgi:hypothetical protein
MLFVDARISFPDGEDCETLIAWLEAHAGSGSLGTYLTELLRINTDVAWYAGLLHLTTPLPIERMLKRRFSAEKTT